MSQTTIQDNRESSIAKSDELGDKNNSNDKCPSKNIPEYPILSEYVYYSSCNGYIILQNMGLKNLSNLLQQKYLIMKRDFPVECCNIFNSVVKFRVSDNKRVYEYEPSDGDRRTSEVSRWYTS